MGILCTLFRVKLAVSSQTLKGAQVPLNMEIILQVYHPEVASQTRLTLHVASHKEVYILLLL